MGCAIARQEPGNATRIGKHAGRILPFWKAGAGVSMYFNEATQELIKPAKDSEVSMMETTKSYCNGYSTTR